jgi:hypothetical protein
MMYKTPTFAEPQQCNRPFSTVQLSAFIIQLVTWQVLVREIQRLSTRSATLHSWKDGICYTRGRNPRSSIGTRVRTYYSHKRGICLVQWYLLGICLGKYHAIRNSQGQIPLRWGKAGKKTKNWKKIPLLSTNQKTAFIYKVEFNILIAPSDPADVYLYWAHIASDRNRTNYT